MKNINVILHKTLNTIKKLFKHRLALFIALLVFVVALDSLTIFWINNHKKDSQQVIVYKNNILFTSINNMDDSTDEVEEEIEEEIKVNVGAVDDPEDIQNNYSDSSTSSPESSTIYDAISLYENSNTSIGIDVSKYQYTIDWAQVKASGVEFAIIRCGYRGYGSGEILQDPYFETNIKNAIANGILVGVYFYSSATDEQEAIEEAKWVVNLIKKYPITYPVAYDFENWNVGRLIGIGYTQLTNNAIAFLNYIKSAGYTPMMYASKNAYLQKWETSRITGSKFWLAHYTTQTDYTGVYHMWQYTSSGTVPGISTRVDLDIAYFSYSKESVATEEQEEIEEETMEFTSQEDTIITTSTIEYYEDYNAEASGTIEQDTTLRRLYISTDNTYSIVNYEDKEVYIKNENITILDS